MALYIPAGRRRRKLIVAAVVGVVVGLIVGIGIGRASAPSLSDKVSSAQTAARTLAARLQTVPLEYEKSLSGTAGAADIPATIATIEAAVPDAVDKAPWLGSEDQKTIVADIEAVVTATKARRPAADVQKAIDTAVATIETSFGIR